MFPEGEPKEEGGFVDRWKEHNLLRFRQISMVREILERCESVAAWPAEGFTEATARDGKLSGPDMKEAALLPPLSPPAGRLKPSRKGGGPVLDPPMKGGNLC